MSNQIPWQDFTITSGAIARNPAGQLEGRLELAEGYRLTFLADATGITLGWQPDEPVFEATRLEDPDDDAADIDPWRFVPDRRCADIDQVAEYAIMVADGAAIVAHRQRNGLGWQYVPADNWHNLAAQALTQVLAQGGALNLSGLYRCPPDLAALGTWDLPPEPLADEADD